MPTLSGDSRIMQEVYKMYPHLQDLAWCAISKSTPDQQLVVFAVEACELWVNLSNQLVYPNFTSTTKVEEAVGNNNFLCGIGMPSLYEFALRIVPDLKVRFDRPVIDGHTRILVFYSEGILTIDIEPTNHLPVC